MLLMWHTVSLVILALSSDAPRSLAQPSISANSRFWIVSGSDISGWGSGYPLCCQVGMNALGYPYAKDDSTLGFNRSVGLFNMLFKPSAEPNALWSYNAATKALQIDWPPPHEVRYCLDNMNHTKYSQEAQFPFKIMPCTGQHTQQWILELISTAVNATVYKIKSTMVGENGEPLYMHAQRFPNTVYPWVVLGLHLSPSSTTTFTFIPVPGNNQTLATVAVAIPSHGDGTDNLVANGGFESCGLLKPLDSRFEVTVNNNRPYICSWAVLEGKVQIVQTSPWSWPAKEGLNSLLLSAAKTGGRVEIAQYIRTVLNARYQLSFYVYAGSVCRRDQMNITKSLQVYISPSANGSLLTPFTKSIYVSVENQPVDWELVVLPFTALSNATSIKFVNPISLHRCGPAIDHVVVTRVTEPQKKSVSNKLLIATCFTSGMSVVGFFMLIKDRVLGLQLLHKRKDGAHKANGDLEDGSSPQLGPVNSFSLRQLQAATNNFKTKVGEGGFGIVYRARLPDGQVVAVKRATFALSDPQFFRQELSVLLRLRHDKLVNLLGFCCEKGEQILVFDFIKNRSLYERLHDNNGEQQVLPWEQRLKIALDIAKALLYLHHKAVPPIIHRDVKSANILLTHGDEGRLADFGLSTLVASSHEAPSSTLPRGSFGYMDPHYNWTGKLSEKSDVYSYGVVMLEMVTGRKAMQKYKSLAEWSKEQRGDLQAMSSIVDPQLKGNFPIEQLCKITQIINACLSEVPDDRPSMKQIVALLDSDSSSSLYNEQSSNQVSREGEQ